MPRGKEAIELCREQEPALIVLDLTLPIMDGFALVESQRQQPAFRATSLLIYSAQEVRSADRVRLKLGRTEFLTKGRGSLHDFELRVIRLLETVTARDAEHAA